LALKRAMKSSRARDEKSTERLATLSERGRKRFASTKPESEGMARGVRELEATIKP
jgi:hypothetical protein